MAGVEFGDPVFSGTGVADGAPDANSAQVTVEGLKTLDVTLTNRVNPRLSTVEVTPGVCAPGATEPTEPTVVVGPTDGITYSAPEFIGAGQSIQSFVDVRALWPMSSQKPQSFPIQQAMSKIFAHCCRSSRLTFGPKTRGFLGERPEFSSVARAETDNFC